MPTDGPDILLVERHPAAHYAVVTINREERGNSMNLDFLFRLEEVWRDLRDDDDTWAIVLTGAGDRFFCTGEDLKERGEVDAAGNGGYAAKLAAMWRGGRMPNLDPSAPGVELWKPIIGAVNGSALAGGMYLAIMCDVRIAAETARFGLPEVRWNLPAPFAAQLQRLVAPAFVKELTFWGGRQFSAQRMYEVGFVNKVVPQGDVLDEAISWAKELCEMGPVAVRTHKELMHRYLYQDAIWAEPMGLAMAEKIMAMEDSTEGVRAFVERRKPEWKLR